MVAQVTIDDIPKRVFIGDTITLSFGLGDYPAATHSLQIFLTNATNSEEIEVTEDGDNYETAEDTSGWTAGTYTWVAFITKTSTSARSKIAEGEIEVIADITDASTHADLRTHAEKTLAAIEAVIENKATTDDMETVVDGEQLRRYSWDEILKLRAKYSHTVVRERDSQRRAQGKTGAGSLRFKF